MPLQDTDNLIVARGDTPYKLTYEALKEKLEEDGIGPPAPDPIVITKPTVLTPLDGSGIGGDETYTPETSAITDVVNNNTLTLTDNKAYDSDGDEKTTIDEVFKSGDKVKGEGTASEADIAAFAATETAAFSTEVYSGSSNPYPVTNGIDNTGKSLIWTKARNGQISNYLHTSELGWGSLISNQTTAYQPTSDIRETAENGYTLQGNRAGANANGYNYVAWNFRAAPGFFDVVTYEGEYDSYGPVQYVSHDLGVKPGMVIFKRTNQDNDPWAVWHKDISDTGVAANNKYLQLNTSGAVNSAELMFPESFTDEHLAVTTDGYVGYKGDQYVAYVFADTPNKIKCGKTDGSLGQVDVGFKPGFLLMKPTTSGSWYLYDNKRLNSSESVALYADLNIAEVGTAGVTFNATGFDNQVNAAECIYVAIAEDAQAGQFPPNKKAFSTTTYTGNGTAGKVLKTGIDNTSKSLVWIKTRESSVDHTLVDTERGALYPLFSSSTSAQVGPFDSYVQEFNSTGLVLGSKNHTNKTGEGMVAWNFRAAPKFFDVVNYSGDSVQGRKVSHDLGSVPGMIIVKNLTQETSWAVYQSSLGADYVLQLNDTNAAAESNHFNNTTPTSNYFEVGNGTWVNLSDDDYVAYLFADTPGLIKCGSYDGGASGQKITTGFKPGWVLIKETSGTNGNYNWVINDYARGFGASAPTLFPDIASDETDNNTVISIENDGFIVGADGGVNDPTPGCEYIYVAIAEDAEADLPPPTGTLTADADKDNKTITLTDVKGVWGEGMKVVNETEVTESAPGADDIVFTSSQPAVTSGTVNTWGQAEWELSVDSGFADKQEASVSLANSDPEQGPTSFTLEGDTEYWVRTRYSSVDPEGGPSEWSDANKFKTGGVSSGAYGNFNTTLYEGAHNTGQKITTGIDLSENGLLILKCRTQAWNWGFWSAKTGSDAFLNSASTDALITPDVPGEDVKSLDKDGFTLGLNSGPNWNNQNPQTYVAYSFKPAKGFFDVVTYSGNATSSSSPPQTISHALDSAPGVMIVKNLDDSKGWQVYHKELGATQVLQLNEAAAASPGSAIWNDTEPTDKEFTVGYNSKVNQDGNDYVAYLFADNPDEGIKCGEILNHPGTSGSRVELGWKPGFILAKCISGAGSWFLMTDNSVDPAGIVEANDAGAEYNSNCYSVDDTGFTFKYNNINTDWVYMAIADSTVLFYDEKTASTVTNHTLTKRYGVDPLKTDLRKHGIFRLTEQPTYAVDTYVKQGNEYKPIRDYSSEMRQLSEARSRLASIEADEINDDATDNALLTLIGNLNTRLSALEDNN